MNFEEFVSFYRSAATANYNKCQTVRNNFKSLGYFSNNLNSAENKEKMRNRLKDSYRAKLCMNPKMFDYMIPIFEKLKEDDELVMEFGLLTPSLKFFTRLIENPEK